MNYPFTESIALDFVKHETTASEMVSMLSEHLMKYRDQTNEVMLNAMDTHDTARLLTLCHGNKNLQRQNAYVHVHAAWCSLRLLWHGSRT